jgi:hypothetical protein
MLCRSLFLLQFPTLLYSHMFTVRFMADVAAMIVPRLIFTADISLQYRFRSRVYISLRINICGLGSCQAVVSPRVRPAYYNICIDMQQWITSDDTCFIAPRAAIWNACVLHSGMYNTGSYNMNGSLVHCIGIDWTMMTETVSNKYWKIFWVFSLSTRRRLSLEIWTRSIIWNFLDICMYGIPVFVPSSCMRNPKLLGFAININDTFVLLYYYMK